MKIYNTNRGSLMFGVLQCSLIVYAGWQGFAVCSQLFPNSASPSNLPYSQHCHGSTLSSFCTALFWIQSGQIAGPVPRGTDTDEDFIHHFCWDGVDVICDFAFQATPRRGEGEGNIICVLTVNALERKGILSSILYWWRLG